MPISRVEGQMKKWVWKHLVKYKMLDPHVTLFHLLMIDLFLQNRKITLSYNSFKQKYCFYFTFLPLYYLEIWWNGGPWDLLLTSTLKLCLPISWDDAQLPEPEILESCLIQLISPTSSPLTRPSKYTQSPTTSTPWNTPHPRPIISSFLSWMMDGPGHWPPK